MIDDSRKLLQDLITPDLKALQAQVAALEKLVDERTTGLGSAIGNSKEVLLERFSALEITIGANREVVLAQIKSLEGKVDSNHASVLHSLDIDRRLERVELAMGRRVTSAEAPTRAGRSWLNRSRDLAVEIEEAASAAPEAVESAGEAAP